MIVGIAGYIGSGKDTIADYLVEHHGFERISFASSLKDACANVFHWDREMLEGKTAAHREMREQVDEWWSERLGISNFSPRFALQHIGTDVLRQHFNDDIWILSLEKYIENNPGKNFVISDLRFPNEAKVIRRVGGVLVDVNRGPSPAWVDYAYLVNTSNETSAKLAKELMDEYFPTVHVSEYARVGLVNYDVTVDNNGSLGQLYDQIESKIINIL